MSMRDFMEKLRTTKSVGGSFAGAKLSDPRAIFGRKRSRLAWLKITLPLIAISIIGVLTYLNYRYQSDTVVSIPIVDDLSKLSAGMKVSGVAFQGRSSSDRPFSVTALSATEGNTNKDVIELDEPQAEIELSEKTWIAVTAEHGRYDRKLDKVDLTGTVTVYHDNGMTFSTDQAEMDLKTNTASGSAPVMGSDDQRQLSAEGFEMRDGGGTVIFKGRSSLKIIPKEKGSGE